MLFLSLLCGCPPEESMETINPVTCLERVGEVQKLIIQRTYNGNVLNQMTVSDATLLATWMVLGTAGDSTKIVATPETHEAKFEPGEARTYTGLGGIPIPFGRKHTSFTAKFIEIPQSTIEKVKKIGCEPKVSVFLISEHGGIVGLVDDHDNPTQFRGIPIRAFFVADKGIGDFDNPDSNMVSAAFLAGWSDKLHIIKPADFDPFGSF